MAAKGSRPTRPNTAALFLEVTPDAKAVVEDIYAAAGGKEWGPKWLVMQHILENARADLGSDGLPTWWKREDTSFEQPTLDVDDKRKPETQPKARRASRSRKGAARLIQSA
ncbi:hypothetical protein [Cellulomonas sp. HD19AZ1]|uniref:hypothetical protein n=1 Tax=Cellulomonas sp. HD19AZ1 TaxID=2559593 RepID=UPI001070D170|nr:hypothetical protein [Cellulomonas sp. HD19AZ1]TFH68127.1 hypothetical protein E4A51_17945 [Cellulomonas sp. HD19AZ1]